MIDDGFLRRFPKPDVAVAMHVGNLLPAGQVGVVAGVYNTNADSLRITIYGKGGHGSAPHTAIDPIVIAPNHLSVADDYIARSEAGGDGCGHGGLHSGWHKEQHYPDQAELGLTVRTRNAEVRKQILAAIARITKAEAEAAGAPRPPAIDQYEGTDLVYNDPALAQRLKGSLESALGKENVVMEEPITGSEDFSYFVDREFRDSTSALAEPTRRSSGRPKLPGRCCRRITLRCSRRMWIRRCILESRRRWRCCGIC